MLYVARVRRVVRQMANIRVVDIGAIGLDKPNPPLEHLKTVGDDIADSFRESGFAYFANHGMTNKLIEDTLTGARDFFALDLDRKMCYERFVRTGYNGYTPIGGENTYYSHDDQKNNIIDYKECYDLHTLGEDYPSDIASGFAPQMEAMAGAFSALSHRVLRALEVALDLGDTFTGGHVKMLRDGGATDFRVLHYPPVPDDAPDGTFRCADHTDYGTISLLIQDSVGGLEIETSPGVWQPAEPIPDTLLCNIGDMMEIWTGGEMRATHHRVLMPPREHRRRGVSRQSMVFFVKPDEGVLVAPLRGDKVNYQPVNAHQYLKNQFEATYKHFAAFVTKTKQ